MKCPSPPTVVRSEKVSVLTNKMLYLWKGKRKNNQFQNRAYQYFEQSLHFQKK